MARPVPRSSSRRAASSRGVPAFALYGEVGRAEGALLHIESISSRSSRYNWEIDAHLHQGLHQVLWLHAGQAEVQLDETRAACPGPAALAIPPGVIHAFRFSPGCEGHVLTFNATLLAEGEEEAGRIAQALRAVFDRPQIWPMADAKLAVPQLQRLFEALLAEHQTTDAANDSSNPVPMYLARAIVWHLFQHSQRDSQAADRRGAAGQAALYTRWVVLLEAHFREHWPVSRYATQLGLSTERLNRLVRAHTDQNAQALLHARLLREACRRLVHVAAPVSRLAFELGFEDPAYFCRFFKRCTGLSPTAYRERCLSALPTPQTGR